MDTMPYQQPAPAQRNDPQYIAYLEQRIAALESRLPATKVVAPGFWTRAFAIWGHNLLAQTVVSIVLGVVFMLISLLFAGGIAAMLGPVLENASYY
ncbi:MAG: hypothetical protein JW733_00700 [Coriobacteriia bacterium]|nr:hypothetical protein [Coriobacteriia bacterium]MBN2840068.1 hypothetical protein [Coriobacteriia bacterium]